MKLRTSVGAFDALVTYYGSQPKCHQGLQGLQADAVGTVFKHLRIGIPSLNAAMIRTPKEKWADKTFQKTVPDYLGNKGPQYLQAYKVLQAMRQLRNRQVALSAGFTDPLSLFCINVLANSTCFDWAEPRTGTATDRKNALALCERFYAMIAKTGSSYKWLINSDVYTSMREEFGGLFSFEKGVPFAFPDGIIARPDHAFVSIAAKATATGSGSVANVHVLLADSESMQIDLADKVIQFRDLLDELAGVTGPGDALYLPAPIYAASRVILPVRFGNRSALSPASHR